MEITPELVEQLSKEVDDRALRLVGEFFVYAEGVQKENSKVTKEAAFESWIIQKLAALQLIVEKWNSERAR